MATVTLPDADVRGYYLALGIRLPASENANVATRCFADPDAHRRADRDPSCSVNVANGAWQCHACGARGGAYDAALATGHTPRSAIDLMIAHGLIERRAQIKTARELLTRATDAQPEASHPTPRAALEVTEQDVRHWQTALSHRPRLLGQLADDRGWRHDTIRELGLGLDRGRITIPIRTSAGQLRGLLRYRPDPTHGPKMLAAPGTRLGLIPHPAAERSEHIVLTEGPPDMIAARSCGLPAIAVPGDHAWRKQWAQLLEGRRVTVIMDADPAGRAAAIRIARDLASAAQPQIIDLAPDRTDGYDLSDWLRDTGRTTVADIAGEIRVVRRSSRRQMRRAAAGEQSDPRTRGQ